MDRIPKWSYWYAILAIAGFNVLHDVRMRWRHVDQAMRVPPARGAAELLLDESGIRALLAFGSAV